MDGWFGPSVPWHAPKLGSWSRPGDRAHCWGVGGCTRRLGRHGFGRRSRLLATPSVRRWHLVPRILPLHLSCTALHDLSIGPCIALPCTLPCTPRHVAMGHTSLMQPSACISTSPPPKPRTYIPSILRLPSDEVLSPHHGSSQAHWNTVVGWIGRRRIDGRPVAGHRGLESLPAHNVGNKLYLQRFGK